MMTLMSLILEHKTLELEPGYHCSYMYKENGFELQMSKGFYTKFIEAQYLRKFLDLTEPLEFQMYKERQLQTLTESIIDPTNFAK